MNSVNLVGRLVRDPEERMTPAGLEVATFSLAVNRAGDKQDDGTYAAGFFECTAFGKTAEIVNRYCEKGKQVAVAGRLLHHRWENQDGDKRQTVRITVSDVTLLGSKDDSSPRETDDYNDQFQPAGSSAAKDEAEFNGPADTTDDDIPFLPTIDGLGN